MQITDDKALLLFDTLRSTLKRNSEALDSVSIPGFGTFTTEKYDERIVDDADSGKRVMLPPSIEMRFKSSVVIRKKIMG